MFDLGREQVGPGPCVQTKVRLDRDPDRADGTENPGIVGRGIECHVEATVDLPPRLRIRGLIELAEDGLDGVQVGIGRKIDGPFQCERLETDPDLREFLEILSR